MQSCAILFSVCSPGFALIRPKTAWYSVAMRAWFVYGAYISFPLYVGFFNLLVFSIFPGLVGNLAIRASHAITHETKVGFWHGGDYMGATNAPWKLKKKSSPRMTKVREFISHGEFVRRLVRSASNLIQGGDWAPVSQMGKRKVAIGEKSPVNIPSRYKIACITAVRFFLRLQFSILLTKLRW